jgi:zinc/manganese transport system permease protein
MGKGIPLIMAWIIGTILNIIAIIVSYRFDFPTGYTIVFFHSFTALFISMPLVRGVLGLKGSTDT